jgi:hypothetical protein
LRIFVAPKKLRINQEPKLVTGPVQYRFGKSEAVVAEEAKGFCYGFLDSVSGNFPALPEESAWSSTYTPSRSKMRSAPNARAIAYRLVTSQ